jgi:hypothetical protein
MSLKKSDTTDNIKEYIKSLNDSQDIKIISTKTFIKLNKDISFRPYTKSDEKYINSAEGSIKLIFPIKQEFKIEVIDKITTPSVEIFFENRKTVAMVRISRDVIEYFDMDINKLMEIINLEKAKNGIHIGVMDSIFKERLKELIEETDFEETNVISLECTDWNPPRLPVNEKIVYMYETHSSKSNQRGLNNVVKKDDEIVRRIKPQNGHFGRNYNGLACPISPSKSQRIKFEHIDEDVIHIENASRYEKYYAKKDGQVVIKDKTLTIVEDISLDSISFKETGNSINNEDKTLVLNVDTKDDVMDSVASGAQLNVKSLKVNGSIGEKVKITATEIEVGGQVHKSSLVEGDTIIINILKGKAVGKKVIVKNLEGGEIIADEAIVTNSVGGKISASEINVENVKGETTFQSSNEINITNMESDGNEFIIDAKSGKSESDEIFLIERNIKRVNGMSKLLEQRIKNNSMIILQNKLKIQELKRTIKQFEALNRAIPNALTSRMNSIKQTLLSLKNDKSELEKLLKDNKENVHELEMLESIILNAKIVNKGSWSNYNKVIIKHKEKDSEFILNSDYTDDVISIEDCLDLLNEEED